MRSVTWRARFFSPDFDVALQGGCRLGIRRAYASQHICWGTIGSLGAEAAKAAAQELVIYYRRPGGQSQFSALLELESASQRVRRALTFAQTRLSEVISVGQMAKAASLSPRQFGRVFLAETGQTPAKASERLRVEAARMRIEKTDEPIETVAQTVGFADPERMRRAFVRTFGHPPQALRRMARADRVL